MNEQTRPNTHPIQLGSTQCDAVNRKKTVMHTPSLSVARTVVLVDLENVLTLEPSQEQVIDLRRRLDAIRGPDVLIEFACSHRFARRVMFDFPFGRRQWRSGADGADCALLDVIWSESVAERFGSVVVFSGDHIFAPEIAELARRGLHTKVVARAESLSTRLRLAAHEYEIIEDVESTMAEGDFGDAA